MQNCSVMDGGKTPNVSSAPKVSVILAVFNGEKYLDECVNSIRAQTFTDFEFIIVDDASTDGTPEILRRYASEDGRIRILTNERNMERSVARNRAMAHARSEFVAVMDADDVASPDRLEKQVAFMEARPEIAVCGGALSVYENPAETWMPPQEHDAIRAALLFDSYILHPTVVFRKEVVRAVASGYDPAMPLAEDYDLWTRLSMNPAARFANIPEVLVRYRSPAGKPADYKIRQLAYANTVREKLLRGIGLSPDQREMSAHLALCLLRPEKLSLPEMWACKKWLDKLYAAAIAAEPPYEPKPLKAELRTRWAALCDNNFAASACGLMYFCSEFGEFSVGRVWKIVKGAMKLTLRPFWRLLPQKTRRTIRAAVDSV
jgi:glycosyltransferase involved in cell wall biosynthesis